MSEGDEQITTHKGLTLPESAIVHYAAVVVVVSLSGCNFVSLSILFFLAVLHCISPFFIMVYFCDCTNLNLPNRKTDVAVVFVSFCVFVQVTKQK